MTEWNELSPGAKLLRSRKFLLLLLDTVISLVILFVGLYFQASVETITTVIGLLQPVFVMVIGAIAWEDVANANNK